MFDISTFTNENKSATRNGSGMIMYVKFGIYKDYGEGADR